MITSITKEKALDSVGVGWSSLIEHLYDIMPDNVVVFQVKEKFGTLRFYFAGGNDYFMNQVINAERRSATICEFCGCKGKLRNLPWQKTLCNDCYIEEKEYYG